MNLEPRPSFRMETLLLEEIMECLNYREDEKPPLENYFSPGKREQFEKDYRHYLNTCILDARHGMLDQDLYLVMVLSFQFIAPLLEIPVKKELELFLFILTERYDQELPVIIITFTPDAYQEGMMGEEEALKKFVDELNSSYDMRRAVKDSVQKRLKNDGIQAIMNWQHSKRLRDLAAAFGRSIIIPAFFEFTDKKLLGFYRNATSGIKYELALPDFSTED